MATGRQTLDQIEGALADLRREEASLSSQLTALTDQIGLRRADEADAFGDLARFKLEQSGAAIAERLDRASREARLKIEKRDLAVKELETQRQARTAALAGAERELTAARQELDALEDRIEAISGAVEAALARDPAYAALVEAAELAEDTEEAARKKAEQAEADRAAKGAAYERDPLFMYLWRRGFGTAGYRASGLTRFLDRWVANLIGYQEARPGYALLTEIPLRLRAHADRVSAEADAAAAAVEAAEAKALAAAAGEDIADRAAELRRRLAELEQKVEPLRQELAAIENRAAVFAKGEDDDFRSATEALARSIAAEDLTMLRREALRTPSPEDERMVERAERARADIARLEKEAAALRDRLTTVRTRRDELISITRDFRQRGWHEGATFNAGDVLGSVLGGFIGGMISRGDFWGRIERSHRSGPTWGGGLGGGLGRMGGGSRSGGGGFRTGRGLGGGGFKTGRKF